MISVIFIKGKLLKLHAPMSIHAMSVSMYTRNYPITTTGSVPVKLPQIQLSLLEQTNTNTKWHTNFVFAKSSQKYLFRLPINLYIQTKHHPVAVSKWGVEKESKIDAFLQTHSHLYMLLLYM